MRPAKPIAVALGILFVSGCFSNEEYIRDLNAAMADSSITLVDAVRLVEEEAGGAICVRAALVVTGDPVFSINIVSEGELRNVRVDPPSGELLTTTVRGAYTGNLCEGSISMVEALTLAGDRANGIPVAVVPDDDVACAREIQVLSGNKLWEVKVASDGRILDVEESDEDGSSD